jgi:methylmalonyl-CoA/ethylmalonyl-CoA epimerase
MELVFHHLGIATKEINNTITIYKNLGFEASPTIFDPIQNVNICFLKKLNHPLLELVAVVDEKSPVNNIINKVGTTPYHTCYEVENIEIGIKYLKKQRFVVIVSPVAAVAFNNRKICFLYQPDAGLIELLEK